METLHLLISGKVQGVFFRETSKKVAQRLSITGWIKNRHDEKVEAMISGHENDVKAFVDWCKSGPDRAKVEEVIVSKKEHTSFKKFEIVR
jgi:acylphosphatase